VSSWINLHALWQILLFGMLAGAGLPALFAVGLLALSRGGPRVQPVPAGAGAPATGAAGTGVAGATATARTDAAAASNADSEHVVGGSRVGIAIAGLCFLFILVAIGWGIYFIVVSSR
jgi:hypothetical protein